MSQMHRFGVVRIVFRQEPRPASFSEDAWDELLYLREKPSSYRTLLQEGASWAESADQVRKSGDLGTKPLLVLTGSRDADSAWLALWIHGLQADLVHLSSKGKHVVLNNSGHGIQFDAPGAVAGAIHEICKAVHVGRSKN